MKFLLRMMIALFLVSFFVTASGIAAEANPEIKPEIKKELKAFLNQYREAFKAKNTDAVMAAYASDALLMGTGPGELYEGKDAIRKAHVEFFKSFDKEDPSIEWFKAGAKGDFAWISAVVKFTSSMKDKKGEFQINSTSVLEKRNGKWVFIVRHFSNLVSGK